MSDKNQVAYIIGIGRSGTSLLMSLLGAHPEIWPTPENYFSTFFAHAYAKKNTFTEKEIQLMNRFNRAFGELQPYVGFDFEPIPEKTTFNGSYLDWCAMIYQRFRHITLGEKQTKLILDKNPSNTLFTFSLQRFNPNAKYILMLRDYRANILSRKESIDLRSGNAVFNSLRWNFITKRAVAFQAKNKENVLIVRYEDLVQQTDNELSKIFQFLNVSPMLSEELREIERKSYEAYLQKPDLAENERIKKKYGDLTKPIFSDRIDKWKTNLTAEEIENTELICGSTGKYFNYHESRNLSIFQKITRRISFFPKWINIRFTFFKDHVFYYLPIEMKVRKFEQFVEKVRKTIA